MGGSVGIKGVVGQVFNRRNKRMTKQEPLPWISALDQGYAQRAELMRRPGNKQVDVGMRNGMVVLTVYRDTNSC